MYFEETESAIKRVYKSSNSTIKVYKLNNKTKFENLHLPIGNISFKKV